jgi:Helix-turn-helix domain
LHTLDGDRTTGFNAETTMDAKRTMGSRSAQRTESVTRGSGNVFADLGFPDAAERRAKLRLACALNQVLEARRLSRADSAIAERLKTAERDYEEHHGKQKR